MSPLGRFTVRGGAEVEGLMGALSNEIADVAGRILPAGSFKALVMIGGYGRGEGGVDARGGVQRPHNNVDLLLVTVCSLDGEEQVPLSAEVQIEVDIVPVERHLRRNAQQIVLVTPADSELQMCPVSEIHATVNGVQPTLLPVVGVAAGS